METYTYNEHRHNYAVWTAARASQRGFTSTKNIKEAIESSELRSFAESETDFSEEQFANFHKKCCKQIIASLNDKLPEKTTYGRAAKIIAIYLKTSVVISNQGACQRSKVIHPPIDSILLTNLSQKAGMEAIKKDPWTLLTDEKYWNLVYTIKSSGRAFDWTLEEFWKPEIDK